MKAEFDKLPRDLEELSALLHEQQALAHLSAGQNGEIVKEYENRENEIKARKNELHKQMAKLDQLRASIAALEKEWRPEITKLVAKVSESFGKFMGGEPPHLPLLISRTRILFFSFLLFLFFSSFSLLLFFSRAAVHGRMQNLRGRGFRKVGYPDLGQVP